MRTLVLALVLALPAVAAADALGPPPTDCARGSRGRTARVGEWCEPTTCGADQPACEGYWCPGGRRRCGGEERRAYECSAEPIALCVRTATRTGHRRTVDGVTEVQQEITETRGPCGPRDACDDGFTCERVRRCVPGGPPAGVRQFVDGPPVEEAEELEEPGAGSGQGQGQGQGEVPPAGGSSESGCGCRVGGRRGGAALYMALLAGVLWVGRRAGR